MRQFAVSSGGRIERLFVPHNLREKRHIPRDLGQDSSRSLHLRWTAAGAGFNVFP